MGIVIGGIFSYLRFFKGRLLQPKLVISCETGMVPLQAHNLHWLDICIENKGSVAVWNYTVRVDLFHHGSEQKRLDITNFLLDQRVDTDAERLIDVGESSYEHMVI